MSEQSGIANRAHGSSHRAREGIGRAKKASKAAKRSWYRGTRAFSRIRRVLGTVAVVLAALVALVPGIRDDVGDRFDAVYTRGLQAFGQLPADPMITEVVEATSSAEGTEPAFAVDGSLATAWAPAADDPVPTLQIRLPQRPDVNYVEVTVIGALPGSALRVDFVDLALTGVPIIVEVDEFELDVSQLPQRFQIRAQGIDRIDVRLSGTPPGFAVQELTVLGGT